MQELLTDAQGRRLRLLKPLGKGGFGAVYLAEVHAPGGLVHRMAVKVLHDEVAEDEHLAARARDEARLMSQLNHDHVVKIHALTRLGTRSAMLMEYVEGIDCEALVRACGALPDRVVLGIIEQSAGALDAAWTTISPQTGEPLRVIHRDIKPSNLLVSVGGVVKVMDFGIARAEFEREAETASLQFGTQRYMAPERWLESRAGPRSDVFSLGVTLFELATSRKMPRLPLAPEVFAEKLEAELAHLPHRDLRRLARSMMAHDSRTRPTAAQVEEACGRLLDESSGADLRRWARKTVPPLVAERQATLASDPAVVELTGTLARAQASGGATFDEQGAPTHVRPEPAPTRRPLWVGAAAALGLLVVGAAVVLPRLLDAPTSPPEPAMEADSAPHPSEPEGIPTAPAEPLPEQGLTPPESEPPEPEEAETKPTRPRTRPATPPSSEPDPVLQVEPVPEDEPVEVQVEAPPAAADPVPEPTPEPALVTLRVVADPFSGAVHHGGTQVPANGRITLPEGPQTLIYRWEDGQELRCTVQVSPGLQKIKFIQRTRQCSPS